MAKQKYPRKPTANSNTGECSRQSPKNLLSGSSATGVEDALSIVAPNEIDASGEYPNEKFDSFGCW